MLQGLRDQGRSLAALCEPDTRVEALVARAGFAASIVGATLGSDDSLADIRLVLLSHALPADSGSAPLTALQDVHERFHNPRPFGLLLLLEPLEDVIAESAIVDEDLVLD